MQIFEAPDETAGGVILPDSAKEKPIAGEVVSVGPGKRDKDGSRKAPKVCDCAQLPLLTLFVLSYKVIMDLCFNTQNSDCQCDLHVGRIKF